jgi:hypothetical protein
MRVQQESPPSFSKQLAKQEILVFIQKFLDIIRRLFFEVKLANQG